MACSPPPPASPPRSPRTRHNRPTRAAISSAAQGGPLAGAGPRLPRRPHGGGVVRGGRRRDGGVPRGAVERRRHPHVVGHARRATRRGRDAAHDPHVPALRYRSEAVPRRPRRRRRRHAPRAVGLVQ